jgi:hypothetical protein
MKATREARSSSETSSDSDERESSGRTENAKRILEKGGAIPPFAALFEVGDRVTIDDEESHMWGGGIITKVVFPGDSGNVQ